MPDGGPRIASPERDEKNERWRRFTSPHLDGRTAGKGRKGGVSARRTSRTRSTGASDRTRRHRQQTFALRALAGQLAGAANGLGLLACPLLRWLLVMSAHLHFAEDAFALHFLLESAERLINVVVADENLNQDLILQCAPAVLTGWRTK